MSYSSLPCDWCKISDPCRYQWLDDSDLPCVFCSMRCMENYIFWQLASARRRKLNQTETEQGPANASEQVLEQ